MKTLYILIGPKGSGKTYIGTLVGAQTDIHFLRVEALWVEHLKRGGSEADGWKVVEENIDREFDRHDKLMIESLGAGDGFTRLHDALIRKYQIRLIKVVTDLYKCLKRVRERDRADHIPVSDDRVEEYNRIAARVDLDWDQVIDNNGPASDAEIIEAIRAAL